MKHQSLALMSSFLLLGTPIVYGLTLDPYLGPMCTGEPEESVTVINDGACHALPVNAESAVIVQDNPNDTLDEISFYQNADCTGEVEATGNSGCIDFTGLGGNAQSYMSTDTDAKRSEKHRRVSSPTKREMATRLESSQWASEAENYRTLLGLSSSEATGSLSPNWDPYVHVDVGFGHGNITQDHGRTWKWQQVALGISIGVPIEEWDDEPRLPSDKFIAFGDQDYNAMLAKRWSGEDSTESFRRTSSALEKRWNYAQCRAVLSCANTFISGSTVTIANGWKQTVNAWSAAKTYGRTLYDFGHSNKVAISLTTAGTLAGYGLGFIPTGGATAQDNDQLGACANDSSQVNTFIQALLNASSASSENAAEANITLPNGHILSISAAVYPAAASPSSAMECDADGSS